MEPPKGWDRTAVLAAGGAIGAALGILLAAWGIHVWKTGETLRIPRA